MYSSLWNNPDLDAECGGEARVLGLAREVREQAPDQRRQVAARFVRRPGLKDTVGERPYHSYFIPIKILSEFLEPVENHENQNSEKATNDPKFLESKENHDPEFCQNSDTILIGTKYK